MDNTDNITDQQVAELINKSEKSNDTPKRDEREGRWVAFLIRLSRWIPFIPIPAEAVDFTIQDAKSKAVTTMQYLQFERQIAAFKFRSQIHMTDLELDEMISNNQIAIMNTAREYSFAINWMLLSGHIHEYSAFHKKVDAAINKLREAEIAKQEAENQKLIDAAEARRKLSSERFK
jgi:predicted oxidoreductase